MCMSIHVEHAIKVDSGLQGTMMLFQFDLVCGLDFIVELVSAIYMVGSLVASMLSGLIADRSRLQYSFNPGNILRNFEWWDNSLPSPSMIPCCKEVPELNLRKICDILHSCLSFTSFFSRRKYALLVCVSLQKKCWNSLNLIWMNNGMNQSWERGGKNEKNM